MNLKNFFSLRVPKRSSLILAAGFALVAVSTGRAQTLLLSLQAGNYNATTGVWTDSSGNGDNATNAGTGKPTLVTGATPNGSSAVAFTTGSYLTLAAPISAGNTAGYTAFVFLKPSTLTPNGFTNGNGGTIFGGPNGGTFQYRLSSASGAAQGTQDVVRSSQADLGHSNTALSTGAFSTIDVTTGSAGTAFRLNGAADGTGSGSGYSNAITFIGTNNTGANDEYFNGQIADIEIYSGILTTTQIQGVEAQFAAAYATAVPEPGTWAMALVGIGMLVGVQRFRARKA